MTTWHWVRHGPTHQKAFCGWRDVPADLSDRAAIARLNAALPATALLVSSDLIRASATADCLSRDCLSLDGRSGGRQRLPDDPGLREFNFGSWEGLDFTAVSQCCPDLSRAYWEDPGDAAPPGGESWNQTAARVAVRVAALNAAWPDADIIAVAHVGVILTQLQQALAIPAAEALGTQIDNLSVTELHHTPQGWQVARINHSP